MTMWQMEHKGADDHSWRTNPEEELSVTELRAARVDTAAAATASTAMPQDKFAAVATVPYQTGEGA